MRLSLAFLLVFATFAVAAEPPTKSLTPMHIQDGFINLFDGESTFGWKVEGDVTVKDGKLIVSANAKITYGVPLPPGTVFMTMGDRHEEGEHEGGTLQTKPGSKPKEPITHMSFLPKTTKPLFNGKDLTGWKVHDEPKKNLSKFDVTKDGELRVTNGPGDLQTTGKYADFLLQFQCKTNGDGLNSGIFFRCIDGQYQNGYECQIQNAMVNNDPTKPKDFGTGAIYRRTPARKIVAKDKEWFSVTLVAHGDQFATWVNGYPVMQWKDERPADDNPRKGLRKAAGHLSIQGHDPTTDILFRKLQIAEFPASK
jgi:hypothetical protein